MNGETIADRRLHPATLFIRFVRRAPEFVLGLPALIGFASDAGMRRILLIALAGAAVSFAASLLGWLRFRYGVGSRDLVIESGVLHRQRRIIPFDRIQDIDIEQPLLARLFGTAKVRIETGGSGADEGSLDTVALGEAWAIRDAIRRGSAPEAATAAEPQESLLFRMDMPRLLAAGLFNFSLVYLAVIGGALQYLEPLIERNIGDPKDWIVPARERAAGLALYLSLAFVGLLLLLGLLTGIVRTVTRDFAFRLTRTQAGFRRRRGLFTLSEVIIPLRRVQLALITSGWLRRRLGWFALDFQTLGAGAGESGHQSAAPFARMEEILPILAEAGLSGLPVEHDYVRVSRRSIARRIIGGLVPLAAASLLLSIWRPSALLALAVLALAAIGVAFHWRRHRYALADRALFVAEGLFEPRLWIVPYGNVQSLSVTRSPLQRRLGLASIAIDTAGASLFRHPVIRDVDSGEGDALAEELLARYRRAIAGASQG